MALERANIGKIDVPSERGKLESVLRMACRQDQAVCSEALAQSTRGWKDTAQTVKSLGIIRDADLWRSIIPESKGLRAVLP